MEPLVATARGTIGTNAHDAISSLRATAASMKRVESGSKSWFHSFRGALIHDLDAVATSAEIDTQIGMQVASDESIVRLLRMCIESSDDRVASLGIDVLAHVMSSSNEEQREKISEESLPSILVAQSLSGSSDQKSKCLGMLAQLATQPRVKRELGSDINVPPLFIHSRDPEQRKNLAKIIDLASQEVPANFLRHGAVEVMMRQLSASLDCGSADLIGDVEMARATLNTLCRFANASSSACQALVRIRVKINCLEGSFNSLNVVARVCQRASDGEIRNRCAELLACAAAEPQNNGAFDEIEMRLLWNGHRQFNQLEFPTSNVQNAAEVIIMMHAAMPDADHVARDLLRDTLLELTFNGIINERYIMSRALQPCIQYVLSVRDSFPGLWQKLADALALIASICGRMKDVELISSGVCEACIDAAFQLLTAKENTILSATLDALSVFALRKRGAKEIAQQERLMVLKSKVTNRSIPAGARLSAYRTLATVAIYWEWKGLLVAKIGLGSLDPPAFTASRAPKYGKHLDRALTRSLLRKVKHDVKQPQDVLRDAKLCEDVLRDCEDYGLRVRALAGLANFARGDFFKQTFVIGTVVPLVSGMLLHSKNVVHPALAREASRLATVLSSNNHGLCVHLALSDIDEHHALDDASASNLVRVEGDPRIYRGAGTAFDGTYGVKFSAGSGLRLVMTDKGNAVRADRESQQVWTAMGWVFIDARKGKRCFCEAASGDQLICTSMSGQLGAYSSERKRFVSSGFSLSSAKPGWRHIVAVADGVSTRYFVDRQEVGTHGWCACVSRLTTVGNAADMSRPAGLMSDFRFYDCTLTDSTIMMSSVLDVHGLIAESCLKDLVNDGLMAGLRCTVMQIGFVEQCTLAHRHCQYGLVLAEPRSVTEEWMAAALCTAFQRPRR